MTLGNRIFFSSPGLFKERPEKRVDRGKKLSGCCIASRSRQVMGPYCRAPQLLTVYQNSVPRERAVKPGTCPVSWLNRLNGIESINYGEGQSDGGQEAASPQIALHPLFRARRSRICGTALDAQHGLHIVVLLKRSKHCFQPFWRRFFRFQFQPVGVRPLPANRSALT